MTIFTQPHTLNSRRWDGMRVGLLGGSFNPPHEGHVHISLAALNSLQLDAVWWLVTPQNPLKGDVTPLPLEKRVELSRKLISHPKILVTDLEKDLGTVITYQSIKALKTHFPNTDFVWIMGMDNVHSFHNWNNWRSLLSEICMAHLTRSPATGLVRNCPARMQGGQRHVLVDKGGRFPLDSGVTYWLMQKKMVDISSTAIRAKSVENTMI